MIFKITDPNGKEVFSVESVTPTTNKSTESLDVNSLLKAKFENVPNEIVIFVHKNKASIVDQILQWGLKHVRAYGYDIDRSVFGGKSINDVTEKDIASVINTKQNDFKSFKIKVPDDREKRRFPRAWFAVCFEWLVDEEHAASVVFDKNGKAIRICQYSAAFSEPEDYEIKDGTYSPN